MTGPSTVICTYRVKEGKEEAFVELLKKHWPTLNRLGLVSGDNPQFFRGVDQSNKTYFVEIFSWKDAKAPETAHHSPEVMSVWEPMGALVEERLGRPPMEFPHVKPLSIALAP
jgi:quinol monooxygenase YgiN